MFEVEYFGCPNCQRNTPHTNFMSKRGGVYCTICIHDEVEYCPECHNEGKFQSAFVVDGCKVPMYNCSNNHAWVIKLVEDEKSTS